MYINKLDDIFSKYNNTYHKTIKVKPADTKQSTYIDFDNTNNKEDPKFKVGDQVRISKFKNIFAKVYLPNLSKVVFVITKVKSIVPWTFIISDLKGEETAGTFYERNCKKQNKKEFMLEKVIKRKGDKLYVKWKGYDDTFNSWIDRKEICYIRMIFFFTL